MTGYSETLSAAVCLCSVIMDRSAIELLFTTNTANTKSFVTAMFDSLKSDVHALRSENHELRRSLEFSQGEIDTLKSKCTNLERQISAVDEATAAVPAIDNRVRVVEDWSRRKNLRITGMPELPNENFEKTTYAVTKLINEKLELPQVKIEKAFRLNRTNASDEPRQILVQMHSESDRVLCLKTSYKLKNTPTFVSDDVSAATMAIRRDKLPELKQKRSQGLIAYFSGAYIKTRQRFDNTGNNNRRNIGRNDTISAHDTEDNGASELHDGSGNGSVSNLSVRSNAGSQREHRRNSDGNVSGRSGGGSNDISDGELSVHSGDCTGGGSDVVPDGRPRRSSGHDVGAGQVSDRNVGGGPGRGAGGSSGHGSGTGSDGTSGGGSGRSNNTGTGHGSGRGLGPGRGAGGRPGRGAGGGPGRGAGGGFNRGTGGGHGRGAGGGSGRSSANGTKAKGVATRSTRGGAR